MGCQRAVLCHNGPAVILPYYIIAPCSNHRFNCECHSGCQPDAFTALGEIRNLGCFMHLRTDSVTYQVPDHSEAKAFCIFLNGFGNIIEMIASFRVLYTFKKLCCVTSTSFLASPLTSPIIWVLAASD